MKQFPMTDADKRAERIANAANARTSKLHAELVGGEHKARAVQAAAVAANAKRGAASAVVAEEPFIAPTPAETKESANTRVAAAHGSAGADVEATAPVRDRGSIPTRAVAAPQASVREELFLDPAPAPLIDARMREQLRSKESR